MTFKHGDWRFGDFVADLAADAAAGERMIAVSSQVAIAFLSVRLPLFA